MNAAGWSLIGTLWLGLTGGLRAQEVGPLWSAPDRAEKVSALLPGRQLPQHTPETLFRDWTAAQVDRWARDNPPIPVAEALRTYAAESPTDAELVTDFPRHISPFARVRSGEVPPADAENALLSYCPFCGSRSLKLLEDPQNKYHATTSCCRTELYGRVEDYPADYPLKPTETVTFHRLDDTELEVPATIYTDRNGVVWELFFKAWFDHQRWYRFGAPWIEPLTKAFIETANPLYAYKIAVLLDQVAETYYGLPLSYKNELAKGKDGGPLTRAEWEAVPRPAIFEVSSLGGWNRRTPIFNKGWINMSGEDIWVEPFARVRHHPIVKAYSQQKYGDPEAWDEKVMTRYLREVALMYQSVFAQKLLTNYQEANYIGLWLLGALLQDETLLDFAGPAQEVAMYNHTYQDGLNGEGAINYMAMPGGYFYPALADPDGWLFFYPSFLDDHPFYQAAANEMRKPYTVRGMPLEFGDQHLYAWSDHLQNRPEAIRERERVGSRNWAGYGLGLLRIGGAGHRMELGLTYSRASLHNASDALGLDCWVDGVPVIRRGGYAAGGSHAKLQFDRLEHQALRELGYPREIQDAGGSYTPLYQFIHSNPMQNSTTVNEFFSGRGWDDNRGWGEVICYKGGEPAGTPGSGLQVLDVADHYSWARQNLNTPEYRRTLLAVEGPDGRPYVLDVQKLVGEQRHQQYQAIWGSRDQDALPRVVGRAEDLTAVFFPPDAVPADARKFLGQVREIERLAPPAATWSATWRTDLAAYASRNLDGTLTRPLPEGEGVVKLRMIGFDAGDGRTELLRGVGPWLARIRQPLPNGQKIDGNVVFAGGLDYLIETRAAAGDEPLSSQFIHLLEGYRDGEESAIRAATRLAATSTAGAERDIVALELAFAKHTDTVIYQSAAGGIELPNGIATDARYALIRRDAAGVVLAVDAVRGAFVQIGEFRVDLPGDFTGTIVDVIGDLTGTRRESALIVRPDAPWPSGESLHDRQLLIRFESELRDDGNEGWRLDRVTPLADGLVRVEVQDHAPFATSWHQVTELPADRPNLIKTWRPMVDHGNAPWYDGLKLWFPERDQLYTIKDTARVGGGFGGDWVELVEEVNLAEAGIAIGDWYVIYGVEPGRRVSVANDLCWRREPATQWRQYRLRATGPVTLTAPELTAALAMRGAGGDWREVAGGALTFTAEEAGAGVDLIGDQPVWLDLADDAPPELTRATLDGQPVESGADLGWLDPPRQLVLAFRDQANPLDATSLRLELNGEPLPAEASQATSGDQGHALTLQIDLTGLAEGGARRNTITAEIRDRSIQHRGVAFKVSYLNRVPIDETAVYLSDLDPVRSFAHGGLIRDKDYTGNPATIAGGVYPKCLTLCPEPSNEGPHGEVIYAVPENLRAARFLADVGISESSRGNGSVVFRVQTGVSADGPWQTLWTSPLVRGGGDPLPVSLPLAGAAFLRLQTTDGGDNINSDHAVWGGARLKGGVQ